MVDAPALGAGSFGSGGSSPLPRTLDIGLSFNVKSQQKDIDMSIATQMNP